MKKHEQGDEKEQINIIEPTPIHNISLSTQPLLDRPFPINPPHSIKLFEILSLNSTLVQMIIDRDQSYMAIHHSNKLLSLQNDALHKKLDEVNKKALSIIDSIGNSPPFLEQNTILSDYHQIMSRMLNLLLQPVSQYSEGVRLEKNLPDILSTASEAIKKWPDLSKLFNTIQNEKLNIIDKYREIINHIFDLHKLMCSPLVVDYTSAYIVMDESPQLTGINYDGEYFGI